MKIGEEPHGEDGRTSEEKMLQASREELENQVPAALRGSKGVRVGIWRFVDTWIVEPIATGLRFLHLVFIFAPVIAAVPMMWFGQRIPDRDNERSGTLLWYRFLVWSMEQFVNSSWASLNDLIREKTLPRVARGRRHGFCWEVVVGKVFSEDWC